jgi:hypothetical protein
MSDAQWRIAKLAAENSLQREEHSGKLNINPETMILRRRRIRAKITIGCRI